MENQQSRDCTQREQLRDLAENVQANSVTLARISAEIEQIAKTVASLVNVVRDSNGNSIVTRLALMETKLKDVGADVDKIKAALDTINTESIKGKYNIIFGIVTGIIGVAGTLLALWMRGALRLSP